MSKKIVKTLEVKSRRKWRTWLNKHHETIFGKPRVVNWLLNIFK